MSPTIPRDAILVSGSIAVVAVVAVGLLGLMAHPLMNLFGRGFVVVCGLFVLCLILSTALLCLSLPDAPKRRR